MRFIHIADIHLESALNSHFDISISRNRNDEIFNTFMQVFQYASTNHINMILIAGDLFDTNLPSMKIQRKVIQLFKQYPHINIYYLHGNHDYSFKFNTDIDNLFYVDHDIYLDHLCITNNYHNLNKEYTNIVMVHDAYNPRLYANKHIDYLALGHIHQYDQGTIDQRGIYCNPGCLEGRGFDECGIHGFVVVDINNTINTTFIPFSQRCIYEYHIEIDSDSTSKIIQLIENTISECLNSDMIRIYLKCNLYDSYPIENYFRNYYYFKIILEHHTIRHISNPFMDTFMEVVDTSTSKHKEEIKNTIMRYLYD